MDPIILRYPLADDVTGLGRDADTDSQTCQGGVPGQSPDAYRERHGRAGEARKSTEGEELGEDGAGAVLSREGRQNSRRAKPGCMV